mgnify:CR=1 FL=1
MDESSKQIHTYKLDNESLKNKTYSQSKQISELQQGFNALTKQVEQLTLLSEQK